MPTITQMREGIAAQLATISNLNVFAEAVGSIAPPTAIVYPRPTGTVAYATSQGAQSNDYAFVVTLFVSRADEPTGQRALDSYIDPTGTNSVYAAVTGTLGGLVDDAMVTGTGRYGPFNYGGVDYLGCEFIVAVMA